MGYKRIGSKKAMDGGPKVSYALEGDVSINTPTGAIYLSIQEMEEVIEQFNSLKDTGVIIPIKVMTSSNIKFAGYSEKAQVLRVKFGSSGYYDYADVPKEEYEKLITAPSVGSYFYKNIRSQFIYTKIEQEETEEGSDSERKYFP